MSERKWQDHALSDIIETQHLLFFHLSGALHRAGILSRVESAAALRTVAQQDGVRPGVSSCLRAVAALLEQAEARPARRRWTPRVILGGAAAGEQRGAASGQSDKAPRDKERGDKERGAKGQDCNGSRPAGWRPRLVEDSDPDPDCA